MDSTRRWLLALVALGAVVRVWALPLRGSFDTDVWKAWCTRATTEGVATIYGVPDSEILQRARERGGFLPIALLEMPFPKRLFVWRGAHYSIDYGPGSVLVLWATGHVHRSLPLSWRQGYFTAAINAAPFLASLAMAALLLRSEAAPGKKRALLFWLNPATILAAPVLGYLDPVFSAFGLAGVLALQRGSLVAGSAWIAAAALTKPQGSLLLPTLLVVLLREGSPKTWLRASAAVAAVAAVLFLPWWIRGHGLSALDGCLRPLSQPALSAMGFNVWWLAGYVMAWAEQGPWPLAPIVTIDAFRVWAGWDPRLVARLLFVAATLANIRLILRTPRDDRRVIPLSVIIQVHAYALFWTAVHENHTFLGVVLAPLLVGASRRGTALVWATSSLLFLNLFLVAGLGRDFTRLALIERIRMLPAVDLSVLVAIGHLILGGLLLRWTSGLESRRVSKEA